MSKSEDDYQYGRSGNRNGDYYSADYKKGLDDYDKVQKSRWAAIPSFENVDVSPPPSGGGGGGGGGSFGVRDETFGEYLDGWVDFFWPLKKLAELGKEIMDVGWKVCLPASLLLGLPLSKLAYTLLTKYDGDIGLPLTYIPLAALGTGFVAAWFTPRFLGLVLLLLMRLLAVLLCLAILGLCIYVLYLVYTWADRTFHFNL